MIYGSLGAHVLIKFSKGRALQKPAIACCTRLIYTHIVLHSSWLQDQSYLHKIQSNSDIPVLSLYPFLQSFKYHKKVQHTSNVPQNNFLKTFFVTFCGWIVDAYNEATLPGFSMEPQALAVFLVGFGVERLFEKQL